MLALRPAAKINGIEKVQYFCKHFDPSWLSHLPFLMRKSERKQYQKKSVSHDTLATSPALAICIFAIELQRLSL